MSIVGQIDWHVVGFLESTGSMLKPSRSLVSFYSDLLTCCVLITSPYFCVNTLSDTSDGTTIVMAVHNNKDILMVPYEDLPVEDKMSLVKL